MPGLQSKLTRSPGEIRARFGSLLTGADVGDLLEVPYPQLAYILYGQNPKYNYSQFTVRKRSGGTRTIEAPSRSVAILQKKFLHILDLVLPVKVQAHGFVAGRSIVTNARLHCGRRWVLNLDLENFFPSINFGRVRGALMAKPFRLPDGPATVLAHLCCYQRHLPQGAPTSPAISNLICRRLDSQLGQLAGRFGCTYSRYADDLTFSTDAREFPKAFAFRHPDYSGAGLQIGAELVNAVQGNGFTINIAKQRLQPYFRRQEVTGLTVNHKVSPRGRLLAQVRSMLHAAERYGVEAAEREFFAKYDRRNRGKSSKPGLVNVIRGKVEFITMVRGSGDREQALLRHRLHALAPAAVGPVRVPPPRVSTHCPQDQRNAPFRR